MRSAHARRRRNSRRFVASLARGSRLIGDLDDRGIRVAIDDAGTGHNGLSHIQKLGAQILKIDKFFVDAVEIDFSARVIVEMLVKAARELKMTTVAEGVERSQQLAWLRDIGVDYLQGYHIHRPEALPHWQAVTLSQAAAPAHAPRSPHLTLIR